MATNTPSDESDKISYRDIKRNFIFLFEKAEFNKVEGFTLENDSFAYTKKEDKTRIAYDFDSEDGKVVKIFPDPTTGKPESKTLDTIEALQNEIDEFIKIIEIDKGSVENYGHVAEPQTLSDESAQEKTESLYKQFLKFIGIDNESAVNDDPVVETINPLNKSAPGVQEYLDKQLFEEVSKKSPDLETIKRLHNDGAQINTYFFNGTEREDVKSDLRLAVTPLHIAIASGNIEVARFLIDNGADVNAPEKGHYEQNTPLHLAAAGSPDLVNLLIEKGADVNKPNLHGFTPLMRSCASNSSGSKECLEILLKNGADPLLHQKDGSQAIHWAALMQEQEKIEILVRHGADINAEDILQKDQENPWRPIDYAKIGNPKSEFIAFIKDLSLRNNVAQHNGTAVNNIIKELSNIIEKRGKGSSHLGKIVSRILDSDRGGGRF